MNATQTISPRATPQIRADWPDNLHHEERAIEMAESIRVIYHTNGNVTLKDLRDVGFTLAEITEYFDEARSIAEMAIKPMSSGAYDKVPDFISKAKIAASHIMPITAGREITDEVRTAWGRFCAASAAYKIDPSIAQKERTIHLLRRYMNLFPFLPREISTVVAALAGDFLKRGRA